MGAMDYNRGKTKYQCPIDGCPFELEYIEFGAIVQSTIRVHDASRHGLYADKRAGA